MSDRASPLDRESVQRVGAPSRFPTAPGAHVVVVEHVVERGEPTGGVVRRLDEDMRRDDTVDTGHRVGGKDARDAGTARFLEDARVVEQRGTEQPRRPYV